MKLVFSLCCLVSFLAPCCGIQFTLDRKVEEDSFCGILYCQERSHSTTSENSSTNLLQTSDLFSTISGMAIFKVVETRPDKKNYKRIATVNGNQPAFKKHSNGIKIHGLLNNGVATLRLLLTKSEDCESGFVCEIQGVDSQGQARVSTVHLPPQTKHTGSHPDETSMTSPALWQLLSLVQQMNVQLALVENSQQSLNQKMESFEKEFRDSLGSLENRLEDKLSSGLKVIDDKVCDLDSKVTALSSVGLQVQEVKKDECEANTNLLDILATIARLESTINSTSILLSLLEMNTTQFHSCDQISEDVLENVLQDIKKTVGNSSEITCTIDDELALLKDAFFRRFELLQSSINNIDVESQAASLISELNSTIQTELPAMLVQILSPTSCRKGMIVATFPTPSTYPVIYPKQNDILDKPYLCDVVTDGGGWIVIQRRTTGKVDFYRKWDAYKEGFGTLDDDFWLGNENIHRLTTAGLYELRVELKYKGESKYAHYDSFLLENEKSNYALKLGSYRGTAGDSLSRHNGHEFTTLDKDNDSGENRNCAETFTGAWWYIDCHDSNLNGKWMEENHKGLMWRLLTDSSSASFSEMKIRRVNN